jgi:hypothetical protein
VAFVGAAAGLMLHMTVEKFIEGMDAFWVFAALVTALSNGVAVRPLRKYGAWALKLPGPFTQFCN